MKFLFSVISAKGHLNPLIPVAQFLRRGGHEVSFYANRDIRETLARAELEGFIGYHQGPLPPPDQEKVFSALVRAPDKSWMRETYRKKLIEFVPEKVSVLRDVIKNYNPDIVIADPAVSATGIAAMLENKKWAALSCSLNPVLNDNIQSDLLSEMSEIEEDRRKMFSSFGIEDPVLKGWDFLSPYLTTCFSTEEFIGYQTPGVTLVGPSRPLSARGDEAEFPWHRLDAGKKKIFVSFGSEIYYQPDYFRKIFEAFRNEDIQVIVSLSDLLDEIKEIPENFIAVRYAPQWQLLPKIDLFITHGGANSVMESLACGVPMLLAPLGTDQSHQLWFVLNAGVGEMLDLERCSPSEIAEQAWVLINDKRKRERIRAVKESYDCNGAEIAADLCVNMAS